MRNDAGAGILQEGVGDMITLKYLCKYWFIGCISQSDMQCVRIQIMVDDVLGAGFNFLPLVDCMKKGNCWFICCRLYTVCPLLNKLLYELFLLQGMADVQNVKLL